MEIPKIKPRLSSEELLKKIQPFNIDREKYPLLVVGIRGYYKNDLGEKGKNDRGIYDDAIFVVSDSVVASFNANTDPSVYKPAIANLMPGAYFAHRLGLHKDQYEALVQRQGKVMVLRDGEKGKPAYKDEGYFGINIHRGGYGTTSSLGCQTVYPTQWDAFIELIKSEARRYYGQHWKSYTIPYILLEN